MENGLVHIYCGDGKGKTTAAVGLAVRCLGGRGRVLFCQFLKDGTSGEVNILKRLDGACVFDGYKTTRFSFNMTDEEKKTAKEAYTADFERITELSVQYDMLILDEILHAVNLGFIDESRLLEFLKKSSGRTEIVLTGRAPSKELVACADYVSEVKKLKHPFDMGIRARKYIER